MFNINQVHSTLKQQPRLNDVNLVMITLLRQLENYTLSFHLQLGSRCDKKEKIIWYQAKERNLSCSYNFAISITNQQDFICFPLPASYNFVNHVCQMQKRG